MVGVTSLIQVGTETVAGFGVGAEVGNVIGVEEGGHGVHEVQSPQPRHI